MEAAVSQFLSRTQQNESSKESRENGEWTELAPGQHLSDYKPSEPDPTQLGYAPLTENDAGPVPAAVSERLPSSDVRAGDGAVVGVCGLKNIGNTCYMNAGLQCVRSIPNIASYFLENTSNSFKDGELSSCSEDQVKKDGECKDRISLSDGFSTVLRKLWSGQFSTINIKPFKETFGQVHPHFKGSRQQDCQEFLAMLLDSLHEECQQMSGQSSSVISETFEGQLCNEVVCARCAHVSHKKEPFVYLSLPLPGAHLKEIELFWVPQNKPVEVIRVAVSVGRTGLVEDIKRALCQLVDRPLPKELLVLAEVKKHSIRRVLADSLPVKQLACENGELLYLFEMQPVDELASALQMDDPWSPMVTTTEHAQKVEDATDLFGSEPFSADSSTASVQSNLQTTPPAPTVAGGEAGGVAGGVLVKWHSCSICLEEMVDSDLLTHAECGGFVCATCLEGSVKHYGQEGSNKIPCPICSVPVTASDAFTALASADQDGDNSKPLISFMQVTVLFRGSSGLLGHPRLVNLPGDGSGSLFYRLIEAILPPWSSSIQWRLCLTGFNGKVCSRCAYGRMCDGCPVERSTGSSLTLKPGDYLTVHFITDIIQQSKSDVTDHSSVTDSERGKPLTLQNCVEAFSKSETLGPDNPWFCPTCKKNCEAVRTLSVSSLPPALIIHLKRFAYLTSGSKLEAAVEFPLELDPSQVCGVEACSPSLHLVGCVCHSGSLQCGHYTAYVRHPVTEEWIHYNDSTVSKESPSAKEMANVYILFYTSDLCPQNLPTSISNEEFPEIYELIISRDIPPQLPLKRASSDTDVSKAELGMPVEKIASKTLAALLP